MWLEVKPLTTILQVKQERTWKMCDSHITLHLHLGHLADAFVQRDLQ